MLSQPRDGNPNPIVSGPSRRRGLSAPVSPRYERDDGPRLVLAPIDLPRARPRTRGVASWVVASPGVATVKPSAAAALAAIESRESRALVGSRAHELRALAQLLSSFVCCVFFFARRVVPKEPSSHRRQPRRQCADSLFISASSSSPSQKKHPLCPPKMIGL